MLPDGSCSCGLRLLQLGLCVNVCEDLSHVSLEDHPTHAYLLENILHLVNMKDQIQLTHILKAAIQGLHKDLYQIQNAQLTFRGVHTEYKVQCSIVTVDQTKISATQFCWPL